MIVFQNLHTVQELLDYEIKQQTKIAEKRDQQIKEKYAKGKNIKSKFLEKSKNVLRSLETIYINENLMDLNVDGNQTLNDMQKNPYINDEKSCITGLHGVSIIHHKGGLLNQSQDSQIIDYSYIDNITNLNFGGKFQDFPDDISAQNFCSQTTLNFNALKNKRADLTENYSQYSGSEGNSACKFEGGEPEESQPLGSNRQQLGQNKHPLTAPSTHPQAHQQQYNLRFNHLRQTLTRLPAQGVPPPPAQKQSSGHDNHRSKQRKKEKSEMRKMKVQYFNQLEEERSGDGSGKNDFVNRFTSTLAGGTVAANDSLGQRGTDQTNGDNIFQSILKQSDHQSPVHEKQKINKENMNSKKLTHQNAESMIFQIRNGSPKQPNQNIGAPFQPHKMTPSNDPTPVTPPRPLYKQAHQEEDDFIIQLNRSINEAQDNEQNNTVSSNARNNSCSSTGGKITTKNAMGHGLHGPNGRKNFSSKFKKEAVQHATPETKHDDFFNQSPQMSALIENLQFGGAHVAKDGDEAHSNVANQNGRLTFPLNLMQSNRKQDNLFPDLERIEPIGDNNANLQQFQPMNGGPNELSRFFDDTSRIAPSHLNFNDLEIDLNDQHYISDGVGGNSHSGSSDGGYFGKRSGARSDEIDSDTDSEDQGLSVDDLIVNQQEKLNYTMLNHSIYDDSMLYRLAMACCLADNHLNLGIRIINILLKIRNQQEILKIQKSIFMDYLEIMTAYIYLRLNQKQFLKQQSNINTSRILEQNQNISRILEQNQNTSNNNFRQHNQHDITTLRLQDLFRDDMSQINHQNNSGMFNGQNAATAAAGNNILIDTLTNSVNIGLNMAGQTVTDVSQGNVSQHLITPNHAALKQQIMCIIQNQDYFVQQARLHWKKFNADSLLVNFVAGPASQSSGVLSSSGQSDRMRRDRNGYATQNSSRIDEESTWDPDSRTRDNELHKRLLTVNIMTMMLLYVQSELLTYKQIRTYDSMYEISEIRNVKLGSTHSGFQICLRKLSQEVKNHRMFSAYKKFENRENIVKKNEVKSPEKPQIPAPLQPKLPSGLDSVTKVTYSSILKFGLDDENEANAFADGVRDNNKQAANNAERGKEDANKKQQNAALCRDYNLFKKGLVSGNKDQVSPGVKRLQQGFSQMRGTADFGIQNLLLTKQESDKKDKRLTLNDPKSQENGNNARNSTQTNKISNKVATIPGTESYDRFFSKIGDDAQCDQEYSDDGDADRYDNIALRIQKK